MKFRLLGTDIYVSFLFMAVITAMLAFDKTGYVLPMYIAVALHESGHLFAMWIFDCAPKRIRLVPAAVEIISDFKTAIKNEILIAFAGPAVNLIVFGVLLFNYYAFENEDYLIYSLVNLLIGGFNLLPVTGLDGGTVLYLLLIKKFRPEGAELSMRIINLTLAAAVIFFAVYLVFKGKFNISFFIIGLYLAVVSIVKGY